MGQGIAVRARGYNSGGERLSWERGETFLIAPRDLQAHAAALYVLKPEELDAYLEGRATPLRFVGAAEPAPGSAQDASRPTSDDPEGDSIGEPGEAIEGDPGDDLGQRDLRRPSFDRSMEGKGSGRRRR